MLEAYGVIIGVQPIGGWRYEQPLPDGTIQRLPPSGCAGTDEALVEMVKMYRIQANIDLGDPAADVAEYIKNHSSINNRFPGRKKSVDRQKEIVNNGTRPYIARIRDWLLMISNRQPRLLIEDDADERAKVCMKCRQNVPWKTACAPCCEIIVSRGQNVRQRPTYKHDGHLGACRLHDFHISTAIFVDRDNLPALNPNAPEECWMRKTT